MNALRIEYERRVLVVADLSNLYYCTRKKFNHRLDYRKFLKFCTDDCSNFKAVAYGSDSTDTNLGSFKEALSRMGFELKFRASKSYVRENGDVVLKSNWDVGIAIDVVERIDSFDVLILGSADGDLLPCVRYAQTRGKKCYAVGVNISRDLREACDGYFEIGEEMLEASAA